MPRSVPVHNGITIIRNCCLQVLKLIEAALILRNVSIAMQPMAKQHAGADQLQQLLSLSSTIHNT